MKGVPRHNGMAGGGGKVPMGPAAYAESDMETVVMW